MKKSVSIPKSFAPILTLLTILSLIILIATAMHRNKKQRENFTIPFLGKKSNQ